MNPIRNPFTDDQLIRNLEITLLRVYLLFDIAQRLFIFAIEQIQEVTKHINV